MGGTISYTFATIGPTFATIGSTTGTTGLTIATKSKRFDTNGRTCCIVPLLFLRVGLTFLLLLVFRAS